MFSNIFVTPSTSLLLMKSLAKQPIVYLDQLNVPDFQVKIRDATGSPLLATTPIVLSTINGAKFTNNSVSYSITQPYGFANLSLRTSTLWQILHTSGQSPSDSAADVNVLTMTTGYFGLLSTAMKLVSTLVVENLATPNSIQLTGPFVVGNLSTPGFVLLQSTLDVYGGAYFRSSVAINGSTGIQTSLFVNNLAPFSSIIESYSSFGVGGSIQVGGTVFVTSTVNIFSTLAVQTVSVEKESPLLTTYVFDTLSVANEVSTAKSFAIGNRLETVSSLTVAGNVSSMEGAFSTGSLSIGGYFHTLSSLTATYSLTTQSSFITASSLSLQTSFSSFSSVAVAVAVSTNAFYGMYLSSGTSFSTGSEFSILSTLFVYGSLSTNQTVVGNDFTTQILFVESTISTLGTAELRGSLQVDQSAVVSSLTVLGSTFGVGGNLVVDGRMATNTAYLYGSTFVGGNLESRQATTFGSNVSVESDLYVEGNLTVLGYPTMDIFDVGSYQFSSLQVTTSSPSVALRASTLSLSTLHSDLARLLYSTTAEDVTIPISSIATTLLYANTFETSVVSSQSLYVENVIPSYRIASTVEFEINQATSFPRGLSTNAFLTANATVEEYRASFVGDGRFLSNLVLPYSTLSAAIVTASTVTTQVLSSLVVEFGSVTVSSLGSVYESLFFNTPMAILSTNVRILPEISTLYQISTFPVIQPVDSATLGINNTLYIDNLNRKVGILTSTPQYDLDIYGSLYCSGQFFFSSQNTLYFSTVKPTVNFSTIYYSSIAIQDALTLGANITAVPSKYLVVRANDPSYTNIGDKSTTAFYIAERVVPQQTGVPTYPCGIFTDIANSTLDISYQVWAHNDTRNVGMNTTSYSIEYVTNQILIYATPLAVDPGYDLAVSGNVRATELSVSTLATTTKVVTSTLSMPTLGLNPFIGTGLNTISTSFSSITGNNTIVVNTCAEFLKTPSQAGSFHVKRPAETPYFQSLFTVYSDAYISSVTVEDFHAGAIQFDFQYL